MNSKDSNRHLFKGNIVVIVTGASRGFGKAIVHGFVDRFLAVLNDGKQERASRLSFILTARDEKLLNDLKQDIERKSSSITVLDIIAGDLKDSRTSQLFEESIKKIVDTFDEAVLVHNAATLGDPSKLVNDYSTAYSDLLTSYFEVNVLSVIKMTAAFLNVFGRLAKHRTVVNISSKAAVAACKGFSLYSTGKAAREGYFRNVALEAENTSVLNYCPGPMQTDMTEPLVSNGYLTEFYSNPENYVKLDDSLQRLMTLLESGDYENGSRIDFLDG